MKITVTKTTVDVDVEGDASEIREALPSILGVESSGAMIAAPAASSEPEPAAVERAPEPEPAAPIAPPTLVEVEPIDERRASQPAPSEPVGGVRVMEELEGGPFELPGDIPAAWRWVSANGMTCHIRTQPGVAVAMCPATPRQIGSRRLHDPEIPFKATEVCEGCNAALVRSRRTA